MKKGEKLHNENKWRKRLGGAPMLEQMYEKKEKGVPVRPDNSSDIMIYLYWPLD